MSSTFFSDFLIVTDWKTVLFIAIIIGLFGVMKFMEKKKVKFTTRMLSATVIGLLLGLLIQVVAGFPETPKDVRWISEITSWYSFAGNSFMDILKMLVVPVFLSIVRVIMNMEKQQVGRLTSRTVLMLVGTTAIAAVVGILVANLFGLGLGMNTVVTDLEAKEVTSVLTTLRGLLPSNPVKAMAEANIVAVVIFAAFLGNGVTRMRKKYEEVETFVKFIEGFYRIITSVAMTVIKFMPYAIIALLANTIAERGMSAIALVIDFVIAIYVSIAIMFAIHMLIIMLNGINPVKYVKRVAQPLILAFTSRSSLGTLPVTIEALTDEMGVEKGVASFVGSLGANMGMNGCAGIYPALMAVTIANMIGMKMDITFYAMLIIVIAVSSLGIAGLPGTATMAVSVTLSSMGMGAYFPLAGGIIAIDPIIDMGRTMLNVNGTMTTAVAVASSIKAIDKEYVKENENEIGNEERGGEECVS